jgi:hypothetical protein
MERAGGMRDAPLGNAAARPDYDGREQLPSDRFRQLPLRFAHRGAAEAYSPPRKSGKAMVLRHLDRAFAFQSADRIDAAFESAQNVPRRILPAQFFQVQ